MPQHEPPFTRLRFAVAAILDQPTPEARRTLLDSVPEHWRDSVRAMVEINIESRNRQRRTACLGRSVAQLDQQPLREMALGGARQREIRRLSPHASTCQTGQHQIAGLKSLLETPCN